MVFMFRNQIDLNYAMVFLVLQYKFSLLFIFTESLLLGKR